MQSTLKPGVILIGMPGAGKSTLGIQLAKELGFDFVDTDVSIQV
ncbi:MAG: AAA family ATPase, partial [Porticoccaceae bacterium]|nr:AAA family ATPase [Porticoccaceae bacterium]